MTARRNRPEYRRDLSPLSTAITEAIARLKALEVLSGRLESALLAARTLVEQQIAFKRSVERAAKLAALEAAIRQQDEQLEKKK